MSAQAARLRELLRQPAPVIMPGAPNALFARIIERAGFDGVYLTGAGLSQHSLGLADVGLIGHQEFMDQAERICDAVDVPVLADADAGFGGVLNVRRAVQSYERRGIAGIHIEDQRNPKRCGHFEDKELVDIEEMNARIRAATASRTDPDFLVFARTDAIGVEGFAAALTRAEAYLEAGADGLFVEAPRTVEELAEVGRRFSGVPLIANMVDGGTTPLLPADELFELGYRIVIYPGLLTRVAVRSAEQALHELRAHRGNAELQDCIAGFAHVNEIVRLPELLDFVARAETPDPIDTGAR